ncbi:uncharacterized protein LOC127143240 isoform X2 [Lates calcarifer]|uniref:Ubiquitin carboxyl-terminal hydrolase n=1 Tax=Lates calcarifer TaxID=8187 RepID=A0AAJ8DUM2_LATCA|nr:uncharacterized protein LOC127143240 isoform X2 [Lates calcarifer]XP_050931484.1 uncharacterized protein LOC127143240 isoform X2 [Lates calcarifer]
MNYYDNDLQVFAPPANKKYHGLLNQGATCYLNSVLQVLFMTEDFREAVERFTCGSDLIDHHLQALFEDLKKRTTYTYNITKKLGIDRVNEQRDAAEYYEKILTQTSHEASKIFHGQLTHVTICSTCRAEKNRDGLFWHLPLELVDSYSEDYSVVDGTEEYFRDLNFSEENQMYCDQCDAKSDATVKCVMKHHPEVLTLLLKRFQFDYYYMSYVKNPRVVDVPSTLHIPENQTYELYAVVEHFGGLRSGHYTAKIKSQEDGRWYNFDDSNVTLLDYQPSQEDHSEKSYSAYLLFYRKKKIHSADTCSQGDREVSTSGGVPPVTSVIYDHGQDAEQFRKREEDEKTEEKVGNDPVEPVSNDRNEQTGIRDMVTVGSVDDVRQRESHNPQENDEESRDYGDYPPDAHTEKGELYTTETQPRERVDEQGHDNVGTDYSRESEPDFKPEVRDRHARYNQLNTQDEMNSVQRRVTDVKTDMDRKTESDKQSENTDKSLTEYLNRYEKHQGSEGLDDVNEKQEVEQDYNCQDVNVDEKGDVEKREIDVKDVVEGKTGPDGPTSESRCLLTKYDLCFPKSSKHNMSEENQRCKHKNVPDIMDKNGDDEKIEKDVKGDKAGKTAANRLTSGGRKLLTKYDLCHLRLQNNGGVGDSKQNRPEDDQGCNQGGSSRNERHEQQGEEMRGVKGKEEQNRRHEYAQRTGTFTTEPQPREGVEDQDKRGSDDDGQSRPEQNISVQHTMLTDVDVEEQAKGQENKEDEQTDNKEGCSQTGLEKMEKFTKNQEVEKTTLGNSNPNETTGISGPKHKTIYVKITEVVETPSGIQSSSQMTTTIIKTIDGISQYSIKSQVNNEGIAERKSDPETDAHDALSDNFSSLNMNESLLSKPQNRNKRVIEEENDPNNIICSRAKKIQKMSDSQTQAAGIKRAVKEKMCSQEERMVLCDRKKKRTRPKKQNKTDVCFSFFGKSQKNADQASKAD